METRQKWSYLQVLVQIPIVIVESDERLSATAEGDLVASIVPPVIDIGAQSNVPELHHLEDLAPTVLTDPAIAACTILDEEDKNVLYLRRKIFETCFWKEQK